MERNAKVGTGAAKLPRDWQAAYWLNRIGAK